MKRRLTLVILMMAEFLALSLNEQLHTMAQTLPQASPDKSAPSSAPSSVASFLTINVNSNRDDDLRDRELTLREAILIANGTLRTDKLTPAELGQVVPRKGRHQIRFQNLEIPKIQLTSALPPLLVPMEIDGTTHPAYKEEISFAQEIPIPVPVVTITPAAGAEIFRGLTITSDDVLIRGLSIYGFSSRHFETAVTPPGDIFISHRLPPPDTTQQQQPAKDFSFYDSNRPAARVTIENNWLGIPPDGSMPSQPSSFGVYLFHGVDANIRRNRIANHEGSGLITAVDTQNSVIQENVIEGNGFDGMPDAIRLEGRIAGMQVRSNIICGNAGSAVFLFKPEGAIKVQDNTVSFNARFFRRSAIYLMGRGHVVSNNRISNQAGSGVTIAAFPASDRNLIRQNQFQFIEGLDIDLISRRNVGERDFRTGDGRNPKRDSHFRRVDTANGAIDAPEFRADRFHLIDGKVGIDGLADPNTEIDLYRLRGGGLYELLTTLKTDAKGNFSTSLDNLKAGDTLSAIATDLEFGTSEPARPVRISDLNTAVPTASPETRSQPQCTTPPPVIVETPPEPPAALQLPRQVHFALDEDFISPVSAKIIDRFVAALKQYPTISVELVGHTDPRANDAYNLDLGLRRSRSVSNYLRRQGIAASRITIRSAGERQRLTSQNDITNYARDRRVEFFLQNMQGVEIQLLDQQEDIQIEGKGN
jgi:outer membrane protein OmpA-like peptidoglycan-associated protein